MEKPLKLVSEGHCNSRIAELVCDILRNLICRGQSAAKFD